VVLGGDSLNDNVLGVSSYWRSVYTVRLIRDHPFRQVIISGGSANNARPALSELMRDFVRSHGIDISNLTVETESKSTAENARAVATLLGNRRRLLMTVLLGNSVDHWVARFLAALRAQPREA